MTQTLIVGAGLAGLRVAHGLPEGSFQVWEARDRIGGRIHGEGPYDLGPSWVWPGQPRVARLARDLGLPLFAQYAKGDMIQEDRSGTMQRFSGFAPMANALRMEGGLRRLTATLAQALPSSAVRTGHRLTGLSLEDDKITAHGIGPDGRTERVVDRVVLAMPPRLAAGLKLSPSIPAPLLRALASVPTWMAGHAKAVAVYDRPFWRDRGLSGDAFSRRGPLAEIHDASPRNGAEGALFGFFGLPSELRESYRVELASSVAAQLGRIFGPGAESPNRVLLLDWATQDHTAVAADKIAPAHHPAYGPLPGMDELWDGRLILTGTEYARDHGGLIEGALESAEGALGALQMNRKSSVSA